MRDIKYGPCGVLSDAKMNAPAAQMFEQAGYDFIIWCDQMSMTIPRTIWTEDMNPAAKVFDIDAFMDPWPLITDAAIHTKKVDLGITACDVFRRTPANLAQLSLTLNHYSQWPLFSRPRYRRDAPLQALRRAARETLHPARRISQGHQAAHDFR